jgi:hypothetical protein
VESGSCVCESCRSAAARANRYERKRECWRLASPRRRHATFDRWRSGGRPRGYHSAFPRPARRTSGVAPRITPDGMPHVVGLGDPWRTSHRPNTWLRARKKAPSHYEGNGVRPPPPPPAKPVSCEAVDDTVDSNLVRGNLAPAHPCRRPRPRAAGVSSAGASTVGGPSFPLTNQPAVDREECEAVCISKLLAVLLHVLEAASSDHQRQLRPRLGGSRYPGISASRRTPPPAAPAFHVRERHEQRVAAYLLRPLTTIPDIARSRSPTTSSRLGRKPFLDQFRMAGANRLRVMLRMKSRASSRKNRHRMPHDVRCIGRPGRLGIMAGRPDGSLMDARRARGADQRSRPRIGTVFRPSRPGRGPRGAWPRSRPGSRAGGAALV